MISLYEKTNHALKELLNVLILVLGVAGKYISQNARLLQYGTYNRTYNVCLCVCVCVLGVQSTFHFDFLFQQNSNFYFFFKFPPSLKIYIKRHEMKDMTKHMGCIQQTS